MFSSHSRRHLAGAAALAAAFSILLAASATAPATPPLDRPDAWASAAKVNIRNLAFRPGTLNVGRGARVVFANGDSVAHTATRKGSFDTGRIRPGNSVGVRFRQSGVYAFHCKIHSFMRGRIVVE